MTRVISLLACMVALPLGSYVTGSTVGSYRMFSDPHRYQLALTTVGDGAPHALPLSALAPHLGLDARRWITPAAQPVFGDTAASLLAGGLGDLAELTCKLVPGAQRARAELTRIDLRGSRSDNRAERDCDAVRSR